MEAKLRYSHTLGFYSFILRWGSSDFLNLFFLLWSIVMLFKLKPFCSITYIFDPFCNLYTVKEKAIIKRIDYFTN